MLTLRKTFCLAILISVAIADKPSSTLKDPVVEKKTVDLVEKEVTAEVLPVPVIDVIQERQDSYVAPSIAIDTYGSPAPDYSGPVEYVSPVAYAAPVAPVAYAAPVEDSYVSAQTPEAYVAPQVVAPAYTSQSQPGDAGTRGYYYYYYPVSTSPVQAQSQPQYAPPRQGFVGANNPLSNIGAPVIVAVIVGIGIIIGIGILVASTFSSTSTSTTSTSTSGRSLLEHAAENIDEVANYVYEGLKVWSELNGHL